MDKSIFKWQTYEYEHVHRTPDWYWALWIISISLAVSAVLFANLLLALFIIIAAYTATIVSKRKPELIEIIINKNGVKIANTLYPYQVLETFWIDENEGDNSSAQNGEAKLIMKSKKMLMPLIIISVQDVNLDWLRNFLGDYLEEVEHRESIFQKFLEYLGF